MDGAAGGGDREVKKEFFHKQSVKQRLNKVSIIPGTCLFLAPCIFLSLLDLTNLP